MSLAVITVHCLFIYKQFQLLKVETQKCPEIKQLLSIAQDQVAPRLKQLKLKLTAKQATLLVDEYSTDRPNSSLRRKETINRPGGTDY